MPLGPEDKKSVEGFKDPAYEIRLGHARLISMTLN